MENLIYPDPAEIVFNMIGWGAGNTMFKECSVRVQGIPTTTKPIAAPQFTGVRQLNGTGTLNAKFNLDVYDEFIGENKVVTLKLFSFPVSYVEMSILEGGVTWNIDTYSRVNVLATELEAGRLSLETVCEYEPITRMLPGNINTAEIRINIPGGLYVPCQCDMHMRPVPGVIVNR